MRFKHIDNSNARQWSARPFVRQLRSCAIAALAIAIFTASSCTSKESPPVDARPVTDELGRTIMVKVHPRRIVSLAPSITETLFALGLGDSIVGVTSYCDYPPEALQKERIGDTMRPSIEKIVALKPDLAIASTASQLEQFVKKLGEVGIPVYVSTPRDFEGVLESITKLGDLTGVPDRASELTHKLSVRIEAVRERVMNQEKPRVFFILGTEPLITVGGTSFINDLIVRAGGLSISEDEKTEYPHYSLETVVARQPEVIFLQAGEVGLPERLKQTPAAQKGRIFHVDDDLIIRPGPRIIDGLEQMAALIHPA